MSTEQPWLDKKNWAANSIYSDARHGFWILWAVALLWNLMATVPILLQFSEIWSKAGKAPGTFIVFLFPLVGVGLVISAINATRKRTRFGLTPLVLDPFPGSLGGHVGGRTETRIPFDPQLHFDVSLACIHSRIATSGKNRRRSESVKWHGNGICHKERTGAGTALRFRFDVPADLPASESASKDYHLWRLRINAELPGLDFDRTWELPVYATGAMASGIAEGTESNPDTMDAAMAGVDSVAQITPIADGIQARFPALQRPGMGIFMVLFGLVFLAAGTFAVFNGGTGLLVGSIFVLLGLLIAGAGVFELCKSLLVSVTSQGVRSRRFFLGYPITTRELSLEELEKIAIKRSGASQEGKNHSVLYRLSAHGKGKEKFPVAERLQGKSEAELLRDTYLTYLGKESRG